MVNDACDDHSLLGRSMLADVPSLPDSLVWRQLFRRTHVGQAVIYCTRSGATLGT